MHINPARAGFLGVAIALGSFASPAGATEPSGGTEPRDYDAPDPNRDALNYGRAMANVGFGNYVIFQIDWFRGVDWIFVTRSGIGANFSSGMQFDYDTLTENLLGHPLHAPSTSTVRAPPGSPSGSRRFSRSPAPSSGTTSASAR